MMAFSMHCLKRCDLERLLRKLCLLMLAAVLLPSYAQTQIEISQFEVERSQDEVVLNAQLQFELSSAVEDALLKGVPIYFRAEADVLKERWYWYDKTQTSSARNYKLAFQPLTRRWRLSMSTGSGSAAGQGLALSQTYDTSASAMAAVRKISRWRIASGGDLEPQGKFRVDFKFHLDVSQLPRPFQIGLLGQTDWDLSFLRSQALPLESPK
jgi:hypothetical protein